MESGVERIAKERSRQVEKEGYDAVHDEGHADGELILAALAYCRVALADHFLGVPNEWPWSELDFKTGLQFEFCEHCEQPERIVRVTDEAAIRMLEKAGALIAAEIDRILREQQYDHEN